MMNNYLRLLLVGSILIILLGLFNNQPDDTIARTRLPEEIEFVEFQPGILPVLLGCPSPLSISFNSTTQNSHFKRNPKLFENQISKMIDNRFISIESGFTDRKPLVICKTGQFLHLNRDKKFPSNI